MPRLNQTETDRRINSWKAHAEYLDHAYPKASINEGWFVDEIDGFISSKVYGHGVIVTTSMTPPFPTEERDYA